MKIIVAGLWVAGLVAAALAADVAVPTDWQAACSNTVMKTVTTEDKTCSDTLTNYLAPVETCCKTLAKYYGPDSTYPSKNCWCSPEYFTLQAQLAVIHYIDVPTYLAGCEASFNISIWYYQSGVGPCAGMTAEETAAAAAPAEVAAEAPPPGLPMRSFSGWVKGLKAYKWGAISFTIGIVSAIGFSLLAWAFVFDACVDLYEAALARKNA